MKNNFNKHVAKMLISVAFANFAVATRCSSQPSDPAPKDLSAARVHALASEDPGILPEERVDRFASEISAQAAAVQLKLLSASRVTSHTNALVCERRQALALEGTKPQLLTFLQNLAESNAVLRVRDLSMRPTPDRTRLAANVVVVGHYRLRPNGPDETPELLNADYQVMNGRRRLKDAALDCYMLATGGLPPGWTLDALSFEGGKQLALRGQAPADQVNTLQDVRTRLQATKGSAGEGLFRPTSSQATMRMLEPARTNFSWEIDLELRPLR